MTLRARLLWGLALVVVTLGACGAAVTYVQRNHLIGQLDQELDAIVPNAQRDVNRLRRPGPFRPPGAFTDIYVGRIDAAGRLETLVTPAADPELVPDVSGDDAFRSPTTRGTSAGKSGRVRVVTAPLPDGSRAVFALSTARADAAFRTLLTTVGLAALVVVAVMALVVWWVIRLGLRPIRHMTDAADAIAGGAVERRVDVASDGTEAARLGHAFNAMVDATQAAEARLRHFVADASHELRTPLTTLRGYSALHASGGLTDEPALDDAMRRINQEALRMSRIVDDLLLLAELDEHGARSHEPVDLAPVLRDLATDVSVVQPDRPVHVDAPESLLVTGDLDHLTQALAALTTNALRHTPRPAAIEIRARADATTARIEIVDHGPGIDAADLPHLFDRFYRADPGRSRRSGGNGLGLAIAASIVDAHGGRAGATSEPGSGSTFWIELPVATRRRDAVDGRIG